MVLADDSIEFGEIVGDEDARAPFALLRGKNRRDELSDLLEVLDDRERKIIFQRFGLDGSKPKTLEEVGKKFRVTRERIRQLQNIALAKLRSRIQSDPALQQNPGCLSDRSGHETRDKVGLADQGTSVSHQADHFPGVDPRHRRKSARAGEAVMLGDKLKGPQLS